MITAETDARDLALSGDGKRLALIASNGELAVFDVPSGTRRMQMIVPDAAAGHTLVPLDSFASDGARPWSNRVSTI